MPRLPEGKQESQTKILCTSNFLSNTFGLLNHVQSNYQSHARNDQSHGFLAYKNPESVSPTSLKGVCVNKQIWNPREKRKHEMQETVGKCLDHDKVTSNHCAVHFAGALGPSAARTVKNWIIIRMLETMFFL